LTEPSLEKILNRLAGKTDVEDALKRLDRLTWEARIASVQASIALSPVGKVNGVDHRARDDDDRLTGVDDTVNVVTDGV
jgi:hypothetical protein